MQVSVKKRQIQALLLNESVVPTARSSSASRHLESSVGSMIEREPKRENEMVSNAIVSMSGLIKCVKRVVNGCSIELVSNSLLRLDSLSQ